MKIIFHIWILIFDVILVKVNIIWLIINLFAKNLIRIFMKIYFNRILLITWGKVTTIFLIFLFINIGMVIYLLINDSKVYKLWG
jgi:hypothetical protein